MAVNLSKLWRGRNWDGTGWVTQSYRDWIRELGSSDAVEHAIAAGQLDDVTGAKRAEDEPPFC